jgi:hypothetical protein
MDWEIVGGVEEELRGGVGVEERVVDRRRRRKGEGGNTI